MEETLDSTAELSVTGALLAASRLPAEASPEDEAAAVGLVHVTDDEPGITRHRCGRGFTYRFPDGVTIPRGDAVRERVAGLMIPPAWSDVWVCIEGGGHIQATGRDEADRKQYLYHHRWRSIRDATKFHRLSAFADALPQIRGAVDRQLRVRRFTREKMLALMVAVLDETLIRVGNGQSVLAHGTFGLTTLEHDHVTIDGNVVKFAFTGKSGRELDLEVRHPRLASQLLRCEDIPGQRLFAYEDAGEWHDVASTDLNRYLAEVADAEVTAKDFRTWGATVVAAEHLHELGRADSTSSADARVLAAIDEAAARLGNTRAVARSSYVDPRVPMAYRLGVLDEIWGERPRKKDEGLTVPEQAVSRLLRADWRRWPGVAAMDDDQA